MKPASAPNSPSLAQRLKARFPRTARFLANRFDREAALGLELTLALVLIGALLWGFVALAERFPQSGSLRAVDMEVVTWMHQHATHTGNTVFAIISWFGYGGLVLLGVVFPLWYAKQKDWLRVIVWLAAVIGAAELNYILKFAYRRERPEFAAPSIQMSSWSFPSGHSMASLVLYGLLAHFLLKRVRGRLARYAVVGATALLVGAIGFSRLYLGVHYLSDVSAGFLAGGVWLGACIIAYEVERSRRPG